MFNTQISKYVLPEVIVSEKMSILQKNPDFCIIKNHLIKLQFGLLNIIQPSRISSKSWMDQLSYMMGYLGKLFQNLCGILIESHWNYQGVQM